MAKDQTQGYRLIGTRPDRPDGLDKVTGRAAYAADTTMPGMIWGKVLRSPHAHARILSIDTRAAAAVPGVVRVVTAQDVMQVIPAPYYGPAFHDQPILAVDKVRHAGEPVVAVVANDPHVAEAAAAKGVVVVRKIITPGETVGASGTLPLAVVIGRADATEVQVRGKPFDLAPVARDNVARFEVK